MRRAVVLVLLLTLPSLGFAQAPPPVEPAAPSNSTGSESGLSEAAWAALINKHVRVETASGAQVGTLSTQSPTTVVLILDDGSVVELDKSAITSVKVEEPAAASGTPETAPVVPAPAAGGCFDDNQCGHPRTCVEGRCVVSAEYVEALERQGKARMTGGKWTMVAGAAVIGIGLILGTIGAVRENKRYEEYISTHPEGDDYYFGGSALAWAAFAGIVPVGAVVLLAGGITYGVGKGKVKRAERYRPSAVVGRDGFSVGFRIKF
jgi:hypothetical protein